MKLETLIQHAGFQHVGFQHVGFQHVGRRRNTWHRKTSLLAMIVALAAAVAVGCETADPADEPDSVVVTGTPTGGGPVEDDPHNVANLETALERPAVYVGNTVIGQATVYQVVSDRGFWLESGDRHIFTLLRERDVSTADLGLERGQVVQLSGELRSGDDLDPFDGPVISDLGSEAMIILAEQEYYLVVSFNTIEVITREVAERTDSN